MTKESESRQWILRKIYAYLNKKILLKYSQELQVTQDVSVTKRIRDDHDWVYKVWAIRDTE